MPRGSVKYPLVVEPGGVDEMHNPAALGPGKWLSSSNFLTRNGIGRPRPGYAIVGSAVAAADTVIGIGSYGAITTEANAVAHTLTAAYEWDGSAWNAITGTWTTSAADEHVRFTTYIQGTTLHLIRINRVNAPDSYTGSGNFADVGGSPPTGRDITVTNGRVLIARSGDNVYRVRWSAFNDMTSWPAANIVDLSETTDEVMGCKAFGPLAAAIYKEDSVWLATAQAAAAAFQFQLIAQVAGPVSPAVIVAYRGAHYWLGKDNVIYKFDGARVDVVSNELGTTLGNTLDWPNRIKAHGWLLPTAEGEIWWAYPDSGTGALTRGMCLNVKTGAVTAHTFADAITASMEGAAKLSGATWNTLTGTWDTLSTTYSSWDDMGSAAIRASLIGDTVGEIHRFNTAADDDGTAISWEFQSGWRAPAGIDKRFYLDGIASYWTQTASSLTVTLGVTVTNDLSDADTESTGTFDLSTASNHLTTFTGQRGTWIRVRHTAASAVEGLEHRGAAVICWPLNMR